MTISIVIHSSFKEDESEREMILKNHLKSWQSTYFKNPFEVHSDNEKSLLEKVCSSPLLRFWVSTSGVYDYLIVEMSFNLSLCSFFLVFLSPENQR